MKQLEGYYGWTGLLRSLSLLVLLWLEISLVDLAESLEEGR